MIISLKMDTKCKKFDFRLLDLFSGGFKSILKVVLQVLLYTQSSATTASLYQDLHVCRSSNPLYISYAL